MATDMEAKRSGSKSIELLQQAIQQLTDSSNAKPFELETDDRISNTRRDETQILTDLISQLESLKEEANSASRSGSASAEETAKALRDVKRQNTVTHWLLSGLIGLTLVWQISEGLFILKVREGVNHPFRSLWSWFRGRVRPPTTSAQDPLLESAAYLPLRLTNEISHRDLELPQMQLPSLVSGSLVAMKKRLRRGQDPNLEYPILQ